MKGLIRDERDESAPSLVNQNRHKSLVLKYVAVSLQLRCYIMFTGVIAAFIFIIRD